jgi:tetratricopeptide (TPR) repeat protein
MRLSSIVHSRIVILGGILYLILAIACTRIPLLNMLGYEFSFVTALAGTFVAGFSTIVLVRRTLLVFGSAAWHPVRILSLLRSSLVLNTQLLAIPLVLLSANALVVKNCDYLEGLAFFLLLPVVSVWFSCALGLLCGILYRFAKTLFLLVVTVSVAYALMLGYLTPAIFSYNFFYGYFPGLSYDEVLGLTWPLLGFRLLTLGLGAALAWLSLLIVRYGRADLPLRKRWGEIAAILWRPGLRAPVIAGALLLALVYLFRCDLGFESTASYVREQLGARLETEHFAIYYSPASMGTDAVRQMGGEHEFRLAQLRALFGLEEVPRITSYVYPSTELKRRLIGTGTTNLTKPWLAEMHISRGSLAGVLKHELAHVVVGTFGVPVLKASLSTGLVEGVAMAADGVWGNRTLHQHAAAMKKFGVAPPLGELLSPTGFATHATAVGYVLTGSFCRYLMDAHGVRPLMEVYRTGDYAAAFGKPLEELLEEWDRFIGRIRVDEGERDVVDVYFRQPTIFRKICPRVVARMNRNAREEFESGRLSEARALYRDAFAWGGGYESLAGYVACSHRMGDYPAVRVVYDSLVATDQFPARYLPLYASFGDAFLFRGQRARAESLYARLGRANLTQSSAEGARVRQLALSDAAGSQTVFRFLVSSAPDSVRLLMLDSLVAARPAHLLARYLRARLLLRMERWEEAAAALEDLDPGALPVEFEATKMRSLGLALYSRGFYEQARGVFWSSLNVVRSETALLEVTDWIERCQWMKRHVD